MSGRLVILSGPSGVGKDTLIEAWRARDPRVERVVAWTTRAPRPGEVDGSDYHFVTPEAFQRKAEAGGFLEHKLVHGNWYGTPLDSLEEMLRNGKFAVLKIDVQGGLEVMGKRPEVVSIFLHPPSWEELERRIRSRGTETEDKVRLRLENAREEIQAGRPYAHHVVNDDIEGAVNRISGIFMGLLP